MCVEDEKDVVGWSFLKTFFYEIFEKSTRYVYNSYGF